MQVENKREEEFTHLLVNINLTACTIPWYNIIVVHAATYVKAEQFIKQELALSITGRIRRLKETHRSLFKPYAHFPLQISNKKPSEKVTMIRIMGQGSSR